MRFTSWLRSLKSLVGRVQSTRTERRQRPRRQHQRLALEILEDRVTPSQVITWTAQASGDWDTASNWTDNLGVHRLPGSADDVVINQPGIIVTHSANTPDSVLSLTSQDAIVLSGGSLALAATSPINNNLTISGGTFGGIGNVTISGAMDWSGGTITGGGMVTSAGTLIIEGNNPVLDGATLKNQGTATLAATVYLVDGAIFDNQASGIVNIPGDYLVRYTSGAVAAFDNEGLVEVAATAVGGHAEISVPITSSGTIQLDSGTLVLGINGSASSYSGAVTGANGTTLQFDGFSTLASGSSINCDTVVFNNRGYLGQSTVAGSYDARTATTLSYAAVSFTGMVANVGAFSATDAASGADFSPASGGPVTLTFPMLDLENAGTLSGSDNFVVTGQFTWGGYVVGTSGSSLTVQGSIAIGPGQPVLDGATLKNQGTATLAATVYLVDGAIFDNQASGIVNIPGDYLVRYTSGAVAAFDNEGLVEVAATAVGGHAEISVPITSSGTIQLDSGTLVLGINGSASSYSGAVTGANGTTLQFDGFSTLASGSSINCDTVVFNNRGYLGQSTVAGSYDARTATTLSYAAVSFTGMVANVGAFSATDAASGADFSPASGGPVTLTFPTLDLENAGTLSGSDNFVVTGQFTWGGYVVGTSGSSLTVQGSIAIGPGQPVLDGATLKNQGTATLAATVYLVDGAIFDNQASGIVNIPGDYLVRYTSGAVAAFDNEGLVEVAATAVGGHAEISVPITSSGTIQLDSGTLVLGINGSASSYSGAVTGANGTTLQFDGFSTLASGSSINCDTVVFNNRGYLGQSTVAGSYDARTATTLSYAAVSFTGMVANVGAFSATDAASGADFSPASGGPVTLTFPTLDLENAGTLSGSDNFVVTGQFTWGGYVVGTSGSSLTVQGSIAIGPGGFLNSELDGRTLDNAGTATWSGGNINVSNGGSIVNTASGTFNDQTDGTMGSTGSDCPNFYNQGLFEKTGGTGITYLNMELYNGGTVLIESGSLVVECPVVQTGSFTVGPATGGSSSSSSTPIIVSNFTETASGQLYEEIGGYAAGTQYGQIVVLNSVALAGTLNVVLINGFTPKLGDQFEIIYNEGTSPVSGTFAGLPEGATVWSGQYGFTITYAGGAGGNNVVLTLTQIQYPTAVALASDHPSGSVYGQTVTFTATVSATSAPSVTPTGSVQFLIDGSDYGTPVSLVGGNGSVMANLPAGNHSVTADYTSATPSFANSDSGPFTAIVSPATLSVTASAQSKTYGQSLTFGSGSTQFTSSGLQNGETIGSVTLAVSNNGGAATAPAGSYTITPSAAAGGTFTPSNYTITYDTGTLTVNKYAFTYTIPNDSQTYGSPANFATDLGTTITTGVNGEKLDIAYSSTGDTATALVGTYAITGTLSNGTGLASNYTVTLKNGTLTVKPHAFSYTIGNDSQTYGSPANFATDLGTTITTGVNGEKLDIAYSSTGDTATAAVGTYSITGVLSNGTGMLSNYSVTLQPGTLTVTTATGSIYVLDPTAGGALSLSGNASINAPGELVVDSSSASALLASGNAAVKAADGLYVAGSVSKSGNATVQAALNPAPLGDPLAGLAAPTGGVSQGSVKLSGNGSLTINPGVYSQINVSGNARLTLNPGVYVLAGGGLTVTGNANISGNGVVLYNTQSNYPGTGGSYGGITLSGNGTFNLTAPTSGPYAGVVVFQNRANTRAISLSGNAADGLGGTLYAPAALLYLSGNATLQGSLIVNELSLSGNAASTQSADNSDVSAGDTAGQLLAGDLLVYVNDPNGLFSTDELARIQDAVNAVDTVVEPFGVSVAETTDSSLANVVVDTGSITPVGGYADGILGCWNPAGEITMVHGWNWYTGSDVTQIGASQYDFQTTMTHELGHAVGLGESSDPTSAMSGTLAAGTVIRTLTTADLNIPEAETGSDPQRAAPLETHVVLVSLPVANGAALEARSDEAQASVLLTMVEHAVADPLAGSLPANSVVGAVDTKAEILVSVPWMQESPRAAVLVGGKGNPLNPGVVSSPLPVSLQARDQLFAEWSGHLLCYPPAGGAEGRMAAAWQPAYPRLALPLEGSERLLAPGAVSSERDAAHVTTSGEHSFSEGWQAGVGEWSLAAFMMAAALAGPRELLGEKFRDQVFAGLPNTEDANPEGGPRVF